MSLSVSNLQTFLLNYSSLSNALIIGIPLSVVEKNEIIGLLLMADILSISLYKAANLTKTEYITRAKIIMSIMSYHPQPIIEITRANITFNNDLNTFWKKKISKATTTK